VSQYIVYLNSSINSVEKNQLSAVIFQCERQRMGSVAFPDILLSFVSPIPSESFTQEINHYKSKNYMRWSCHIWQIYLVCRLLESHFSLRGASISSVHTYSVGENKLCQKYLKSMPSVLEIMFSLCWSIIYNVCTRHNNTAFTIETKLTLL
jgi:hypothetical protein